MREKNAIQTREKICAVHGQDALSTSAVKYWFYRLKDGNFNVHDAPLSGWPFNIHTGRIVTVNIIYN